MFLFQINPEDRRRILRIVEYLVKGMANSIHSKQVRYDVASLLTHQFYQDSVGQPRGLTVALLEGTIELYFIDRLAEAFFKMRICIIDRFEHKRAFVVDGHKLEFV